MEFIPFKYIALMNQRTFLLFFCMVLSMRVGHAQTISANAGDAGMDVLMSVHTTADGGWISCGRWDSETGDFEGDPWLWKWDASGNPEWSVAIPLEGDQTLYDVVQLADAGFVAVGLTDDGGFGAPLMPFAMQVDSEGALIASFTGYESAGLFAVAQAPGGSIIAIGGQNSNPDSALWMEFDPVDFTLLDAGEWLVFENHSAHSMASDGEGGWYVAGAEGDQIFVSRLTSEMEEFATGTMQLSGLAAVKSIQFDGDAVHVAVNDKNEFNEWRAGRVRFDPDLAFAEHHVAGFPFESSSAAYLPVPGGTGGMEGLLVGYAQEPTAGGGVPFVLRHGGESEWTGGGVVPVASEAVMVRDATVWAGQILLTGQILSPEQGWQGWIQSIDIPTGIQEQHARLKRSISPNPTCGPVQVTLPTNCGCRWVSTSGRNVTSAVRRTGGSGQFDLSALASGLYFAVPECPGVSALMVLKTP